MKKILFLLTVLFTVGANAQEVKELEFIGETALLNKDNTLTLLDKHLTSTRTVASTGLILTGIGKARTQMQIEGCCSTINTDSSIKLIIKNTDNQNDPLSIIKIFKLEKKAKYRRAELASVSSLGSVKDNNLDYIPFIAKKYGTSSYIISLENLEPGEYGIMALNPNMLNEKQRIVSTFNVK